MAQRSRSIRVGPSGDRCVAVGAQGLLGEFSDVCGSVSCVVEVQDQVSSRWGYPVCGDSRDRRRLAKGVGARFLRRLPSPPLLLFGKARASVVSRGVNADDEALTLRALKGNNIKNEVIVAHDGVEALDFLFGTGKHAGRDARVMPQVTLLDLKLPRIDGLEVLQRYARTSAPGCCRW